MILLGTFSLMYLPVVRRVGDMRRKRVDRGAQGWKAL
jgi:hypothetical protein